MIRTLTALPGNLCRLGRHAGFAALALTASANAALALGGQLASPSGWGVSNHVVMVLGTRGSVCTGTVLSPTVIVTAAHCTAGSKQIAVAYFEDGRPILQQVSAVARNPGFSSNSAVSVDVALLRLTESLPGRFQPVTMDTGQAGREVGETMMIAGFGLAEEKDFKSAGTLRTARVDLLPKVYPRFLRLGKTGNLDDLAICKGDSGGPVFAGGSVLVGVVYAAERTGKAKTCGATAQAVRLAPQMNWINGVLARW